MLHVIDACQFYLSKAGHNDAMMDESQNAIYYDNLMQRYLDVCNQSLSDNKDRFPFKQIFEAAKMVDAGRMIEVKISDDAPAYVMRIKDGEIIFSRHAECGSCECDATWQVERDYLDDVVSNTQIYVQNPARLNWEWMYL